MSINFINELYVRELFVLIFYLCVRNNILPYIMPFALYHASNSKMHPVTLKWNSVRMTLFIVGI